MDWSTVVQAERPGELSSLLAYSDWLEESGDDYHVESIRRLPELVEVIRATMESVRSQLNTTVVSGDETMMVTLASRSGPLCYPEKGCGVWTIAARATDSFVFGVPAERSPRNLLAGSPNTGGTWRSHPGVDVLLEAFGLEMLTGGAGKFRGVSVWFLRASRLKFHGRTLKIDPASGSPACFEVNLIEADGI